MTAPESLDRAELLFVLGVAAVLVSGLFPWLTASEAIPVTDPSERAEGLSSFSEADTAEQILGIDRVDWVVLAGIGLVAAAIVLTEPWSQVVLGVGGASGVAAVGLGVFYLFDPVWMYSAWLKPELGAVTSVGPGVYLAISGGLLQCGGCYFGHRGPATTGARSLDQPRSGGPQQNQPASRRPPQGGQQQPPEEASQRHEGDGGVSPAEQPSDPVRRQPSDGNDRTDEK
ncbi:hypothetical protein [Halovenus halobia]|uniref:hypothetical protein n=1 Tax=Halovenus halobia TaxID=3396622 RepID=UPI003F569691